MKEQFNFIERKTYPIDKPPRDIENYESVTVDYGFFSFDCWREKEDSYGRRIIKANKNYKPQCKQ